jgi:hypothetical protein
MTMQARKTLEYIRGEVVELYGYTCAGGALEYAFDLCVDEKELYAAFKILNDLNDRIATEIDNLLEGEE